MSMAILIAAVKAMKLKMWGDMNTETDDVMEEAIDEGEEEFNYLDPSLSIEEATAQMVKATGYTEAKARFFIRLDRGLTTGHDQVMRDGDANPAYCGVFHAQCRYPQGCGRLSRPTSADSWRQLQFATPISQRVLKILTPFDQPPTVGNPNGDSRHCQLAQPTTRSTMPP
jgi:hypothetical protein